MCHTNVLQRPIKPNHVKVLTSALLHLPVNICYRYREKKRFSPTVREALNFSAYVQHMTAFESHHESTLSLLLHDYAEGIFGYRNGMSSSAKSSIPHNGTQNSLISFGRATKRNIYDPSKFSQNPASVASWCARQCTEAIVSLTGSLTHKTRQDRTHHQSVVAVGTS